LAARVKFPAAAEASKYIRSQISMSNRLCKFYSAPPTSESAAGSRSRGDRIGRTITSLAHVAIAAPVNRDYRSRSTRLPVPLSCREESVRVALLGSQSRCRPDALLPGRTEAAREIPRGSLRPRSFFRSAAASRDVAKASARHRIRSIRASVAVTISVSCCIKPNSIMPAKSS
jgi:hypothetical protein